MDVRFAPGSTKCYACMYICEKNNPDVKERQSSQNPGRVHQHGWGVAWAEEQSGDLFIIVFVRMLSCVM